MNAWISGNINRSPTPNIMYRSVDLFCVLMSVSPMRDALVVSVAYTLRPVNFNTNHVSSVPNMTSPASKLARKPGLMSCNHLILEVEE